MKSSPIIERRILTNEVLSLCIAGATHSFLLFSFFPYAGYMGVSLLEDNDQRDVTVNNVGIYAGLLGATFTLGRFLGFLPWKFARKSLGEKNALVLSLLLTGLSSLFVGLSTTFVGALLARLTQGVSNCISGSVKRAAINARHNQKHELILQAKNSNSGNAKLEEEIYDANPEALVLSVMWWGTALGPIVGGLLSDPGFLGMLFGWDLDTTTTTTTTTQPSAWYNTYPYLLSNGCSAILCWLSMVGVILASNNPPPLENSDSKMGEIQPLLAPPTPTTESDNKNKDFHSKTTESKRLWESFRTLWKTNKDAKYHLIAYWCFSFVVVCCDEALPLFLITKSTGLGLTEGRVGLLLSVTGFLVAIGHHAALDNIFDTENGAKDGMYRVLRVCAFFGNIPVVLVPLSLLLNNSGHKSPLLGLTLSSFLYLVLLFAFLRGSASIFFSLIGIKTGRTLRVVHKDEAARIMTMGALLVRSLAPIVAGAIVSHFMAPISPSPPTVSLPLYSAWMIWIVIGLVFGLTTTILTISLSKKSASGVVTEKQQHYIANRLVRMGSLRSLADSLGDFYGSASKSICTKLKHSFAFSRMARERRGSSIVVTLSDIPNEDIHETGARWPTWKEHTVAPGVDFDKVSFFIIGTHKKDQQCCPHVLAPPIMDALQKYLPTNCSESNFWLKYSLLRDGASMHSMEAKSGLARNTILAIETLNGDVFGCFMTKVRIWITYINKSSSDFDLLQ